MSATGMNYNNYAGFREYPPHFSSQWRSEYDRGEGINQIDENNLTVKDVFLTPFLFLQEHRKNYKDMASTALKGVQANSELSKLFFSDENFKRIQKQIKKEIFRRTNGEFKLEVDQEQRDLFLAMRAVYMQHARFLDNQIVRQVKRLNKKVVDETVPGVITNLKQYYGYLKEINKPLSVFPQMGINTGSRGRRVLPSVMTTFGI